MFGTILDMLSAAFDSPVSETDYHDLVRCIREYGASKARRSVEQEMLAARGWPASYDVCEQSERVRFALEFGGVGNARLQAAIAEWDRNSSGARSQRNRNSSGVADSPP